MSAAGGVVPAVPAVPVCIFEWGFSNSPSEQRCRESDVLRRSLASTIGLGKGPASVRVCAPCVSVCPLTVAAGVR
jgi:hypothetical protein